MSASDLAGLRPAQSPNFSAVASLGWSRSAKEFRVDLRYSGAQYEDDQNRLRLPSATTLDTFASLPLASGAALTFRTENLFNANVVAGLTSDGVRERATPRTVWLGLRFRSTTP
jgi:outer membrane receptor protein involved in Fe transport